ncbi:hypothetical protein VTI74DRAFT_11258 [Chaetomium olivicolor]
MQSARRQRRDLASPEAFLLPISDRAAFLARAHVGTTMSLVALCLAPFTTRICVRVWPAWRFGWDDAFIVAGLVLDYLRRSHDTTPGVANRHFLFLNVCHPDWALLERELFLQPQLVSFEEALYAIILAYFAIPICEQTDVMVSSIGSAINIATDLILSAAPIFIFQNLRRPLRERVLICSLTGIGLFATVASIMKAVVIAEWIHVDSNDKWASAISIATWTVT